MFPKTEVAFMSVFDEIQYRTSFSSGVCEKNA